MTFKCVQVLLSSLLIVTGGHLSASQALNSRECELIDAYERSENTPFSEHFANMVHQREFCFSTGSDCSVPLQKRADDFHVVILGDKHLPSAHMRQVARTALEKVVAQFKKASGIAMLTGKRDGVSNFIYLVFVDRELAIRRFDDYTSAWIAPRSVAANADEKSKLVFLFKEFLKDDQTCRVIHKIRPSGRIDRAQIWIRTDVNETMMRQCIAEEVFNSIGLSEGTEVASIFDYSFSHNKSDTELSDFDLLLLKLLYRDELKVGSTRPQTIESVSNVFRSECPAADQTAQP